MERAISLASEALRLGEPPYGAIVVDARGTVIAEATDEVRGGGDFTLHAEVTAVRAACKVAGPDLRGCTLYTTVEPCPMCFTAAWLARVGRVVFGSSMQEVDAETRGSQRELLVPAERMNALSGAPLALSGGVLAERCIELFRGARSHG